MPFVLSTLSNAQNYTIYRKTQNKPGVRDQGPRVVVGQVKINGGANIANKALVTPKGVVTEVTADQLKTLEACTSFQKHKDRGFITVLDKDPRHEVEKVAKDMTEKDKSAPLTEGAMPAKEKVA